MSDDEKESLKKTLPDLVRETPRARLAKTRFKKLIEEGGGRSLRSHAGASHGHRQRDRPQDPIRRLIGSIGRRV